MGLMPRLNKDQMGSQGNFFSTPLSRIFDKLAGNALARFNSRNSKGRAVSVQRVLLYI